MVTADKSKNFIVYKHTCPNGKVYIGITMQNPKKRWGSGMGYQQNAHFFRAIVKYGWDNIKHEILYEGLSEEEAYKTERRLIKEYKSNEYAYGYNRSEGGEYSGSGVHTKGKRNPPHLTGDDSFNAKCINQYNLYGELIKTWGSEVSIAKYYGLKNASGVSLSCKFKQLAYRGCFWLYQDEDYRIQEKLEEFYKCTERQRYAISHWVHSVNKTHLPKTNKKLKPVLQFDLNGKLIKTWNSEKEAAKQLNMPNASQISNCCRFTKLATHGYFWLYADEKDRITEKLEQFRGCPQSQRSSIICWRKNIHRGQSACSS